MEPYKLCDWFADVIRRSAWQCHNITDHLWQHPKEASAVVYVGFLCRKNQLLLQCSKLHAFNLDISQPCFTGLVQNNIMFFMAHIGSTGNIQGCTDRGGGGVPQCLEPVGKIWPTNCIELPTIGKQVRKLRPTNWTNWPTDWNPVGKFWPTNLTILPTIKSCLRCNKHIISSCNNIKYWKIIIIIGS